MGYNARLLDIFTRFRRPLSTPAFDTTMQSQSLSRNKPASDTGSTSGAAPKVGFVSLGCPKALVDSEQILTQLRAEGYETAKSYDGADLVIVNTCGFIDAAVQESLDAIGEALAENGKVIVTGCLGAKKDAPVTTSS
jgi:ribosomal protein S12 methylthiotransferase